MMSPCFDNGERKYWWLNNRKAVEKYLRDARVLIATGEESEMISGLNLIDLVLRLSPQSEAALELKATTLLNMGRFKDVANLLQQHIPSYNKMVLQLLSQQSDNTSSSSEEKQKLLPSTSTAPPSPSINFFPVSRLIACLCKNCQKQDQCWRYFVLGEACCHLGLMEDAMLLLQTGKRLSSAAFRRQSVSLSDDTFTLSNKNTTTPVPEPDRLLNQIKTLLGRRTAALAALDAGLYSEAIRHFSKIIDNRRGTPQAFLADCYVHRAQAYRAASRFADSIADCNRTLVLDPTSLPALTARASLLEQIRCLPDSLRDLQHLNLLYTSILRDRKLPGPLWKSRQHVKYDDVQSSLETLSAKIQELKQRVGSGEVGSVDFYALIGLRRGCTRSELERARLLLCLRHRPDKAANFIARCEYVDDRDLDTVKDQAKMMALMLYRLIQKGYTSVMNTIMDEEAAERQRVKATAAALQAATAAIQVPIRATMLGEEFLSRYRESASVMQGAFCRDIAVGGNLLSHVGFTRQIPVNYEALSC